MTTLIEYTSKLESLHVDKGLRGSFIPVRLPPEMADYKRGKVQFDTKFFESAFGSIRSVQITSPEIDILNIFFFPHAEWSIPTYAMEFVLFGEKPIVTLIDMVALCEGDFSIWLAHRVIEEIRRKFGLLQDTNDAPELFGESRSRNDFFTLPNDLKELDAACDAHKYAWNQLLNNISSAQRLNRLDQNLHELKMRDYKAHHRVNSPALPCLNRLFGEKWTDNFLRNYLFA